jgi:hypothetical protein
VLRTWLLLLLLACEPIPCQPSNDEAVVFVLVNEYALSAHCLSVVSRAKASTCRNNHSEGARSLTARPSHLGFVFCAKHKSAMTWPATLSLTQVLGLPQNPGNSNQQVQHNKMTSRSSAT